MTITAQWDATTERLVQFAERARYDALPPDIVRACKLRLIDTFASALGACDEPLSEAARKVAARTRGAGEEARRASGAARSGRRPRRRRSRTA